MWAACTDCGVQRVMFVHTFNFTWMAKQELHNGFIGPGANVGWMVQVEVLADLCLSGSCSLPSEHVSKVPQPGEAAWR